MNEVDAYGNVMKPTGRGHRRRQRAVALRKARFAFELEWNPQTLEAWRALLKKNPHLNQFPWDKR